MDETQGQIGYLLDRLQKITEALYRVTDYFSDTEPLKWVLRKDAVETLNLVLKIDAFLPNDAKHRISEEIKTRIRTLLRILEVASCNSFMSETNFNVLKREYTTIMDFLTSNRDNLLLEQISLSDYHDKKTNIGHKSDVSIKPVRPLKPVSTVFELKDDGESGDGAVFRPAGPSGQERRDRILSFIKGQNWVSVGDLAAIFQGKISGKTIQRDLIGMANEGLLLKEGDKRWRRYRFPDSQN